MVFPDHLQRVTDDGQVPQSQKVHLEKAQFLDGRHVELGRKSLIGQVQRNVFIQRKLGDHDARGVGRRVTRHAFDGSGHVYDAVGRLVLIIHFFEIRARLQRFVDGHLQGERDSFCDGVRILIADVEHTAYVPDSLFRLHRAEGDDLGDVVLAVFLRYIVDDLAAPFIAEIDIDIRHADALRVQEPLENQTVLDWVHIGDPQCIGHDGTCCRATAGPDHDAFAFGVIDEIPDDEEVFHIPHVLDGLQLIVQPLLMGLPVVRIALFQSLLAELPQICPVVHPVRSMKLRQMKLAEGEFHIAAFCDLPCVFDCLRRVGEDLLHLLFRFQIILIVGEAHAVFFVYGRGCLDAHQYILRLRVFTVHIVDIVGRDKRNAGLLMEPFHVRQDPRFLFKTLILQFQKVIAFPEDLQHFQRFSPGAIVIAVEQIALHGPRQTRGCGDDSVAVPAEHFLVDPRFIVEPVSVAFRNDLHEIFVPGVVLGKQDQVIHDLVLFGVLVEAGPGSDIDLTANDRLDALCLAGPVKFDHAKHDPVVRNGQGVHSKFLRPRYQGFDPGRAIQKAVFRMYMKMCKIHRQFHSFFNVVFYYSIFSLYFSSGLKYTICIVKKHATDRCTTK